MSKKKMGRPSIDIPMHLVDVACQFNATSRQVREILATNGVHVSEDTLNRFIKNKFGDTFAEYRDKKTDLSRMKLVQKAMKMALDGNATILIFCLKNLCGWKDRYDNPTPADIEALKLAYAEPKKASA